MECLFAFGGRIFPLTGVQAMKSKALNKQIYDENWDQWVDMKVYGPASRWLRALISDLAGQIGDSPLSVRDVGCGEGTNTQMLAEIFPAAKVVGVDMSSTAIGVANARYRHPNLQFVCVDKAFEEGSEADLVCCFDVLEHVDEWREFLRELTGLSRHYLMLSFPTGRMRPFEVNVGHVRNYRSGEVETALAELGFEALHVAYAGFPFYSPLYRDLCQISNVGNSNFTKGTYGWRQKLVSGLLYFVFRHLSSKQRHGDQFVGLFRRSEDGLAVP